MPIVQIHILEGRDVNKKRAMAKEVTDAVCRTLECAPEKVRVVISEMKKEHFAEAGVLAADVEAK